MSEQASHIRIDTQEVTFVLSCQRGDIPFILYFGARLDDNANIGDLALLQTHQGARGMETMPVQPSLAIEPGLGYPGTCGFSAHRSGQGWGSMFTVTSVEDEGDGYRLCCGDDRSKMALEYRIGLTPNSGLLAFSARLVNQGQDDVDVNDMATVCLPVPQHMEQIIGFSGRWSREFQTERIKRFAGSYLRENRRGRTSNDCFPAVILCEENTDEASGEAYAFHLAWSGNSRLRVDSNSDGSCIVSLGALLFPGEVRLAPGEVYESPELLAGFSGRGLSALSRQFHNHLRENIMRPSVRAKPRPVHYNSWEAVYFDHDEQNLKTLATNAAAIGVERFVLDDGWFGARRDTTAGLGDWYISEDIYPQGLKSLIDHVTGLGMEMGIWVEPEMVNPDSDLFRKHPDWVLAIDGVEQVHFRDQYVLDIARPDTSDYLFEKLDALLRDHDISYLKWDMNRDLNHPGNGRGHAGAHAYNLALLKLLERLRLAHPHVEIESCSSGGARADFGILKQTDRIWTSDNNDALERQVIQRGASHFLPLEVLGSHVGPRDGHITGRIAPMAMRAGTALMGHMGLELNLLEEQEEELEELAHAITLYKQHRGLLHSGNYYRLNAPDHINAVGVVAADEDEALYSVAVMEANNKTSNAKLHFAGLDGDSNYRIRMVWPLNFLGEDMPSIIEAMALDQDGSVISGNMLMRAGLRLPVAPPLTVFLLHLQRERD